MSLRIKSGNISNPNGSMYYKCNTLFRRSQGRRNHAGVKGDASANPRPRGAGGYRGDVAPPDFGRSVNPISTKGADDDHHITFCPPGFSDLLKVR